MIIKSLPFFINFIENMLFLMYFANNMSRLSNKEIQKLVDKIRTKYSEYAEEYGEHRFNVELFNDRYMAALRSKLNVQNFLYAEILALEDIIKQIEDEIKEVEDRQKIKQHLDEIADKHVEMIENYPEFHFHKKVNYEISKLFGALMLYYNELFDDIREIIHKYKDYDLNTLLREHEQEFDNYCYEKKHGLSARMEDFILIINKYGHLGAEYEREEQKFIQNIGVFINDYLMYLKRVIKTLNELGLISRSDIDFIKSNIDFLSKFLVDFRLTGFKKNKPFRFGY